MTGPPSPAPPRLRLLIVEDEPSIGVALSRLLSRWNFVPTVARTADAALAILADEPIDLVLLDYWIGAVRGDEFYRSLSRTHPHLRERVLFMTGDYEEGALKTIEATGRPFVLKPFEVGLLVDQLLAAAHQPTTRQQLSDRVQPRTGQNPPRSA